MQQRCTTCGVPLQPGNPVCTNCGTPVSSGSSGSYGSGAYDPTVRASAPPNTGYGQPSYGAPPQPNYGAPPPPNYGAPPPPNYGSAPYGAPAYGAPPQPQPGFGPPLAPPGYPVMQPPQKSKRGLFLILGGVGVAVIIVVVACVALLGAFKFKQVVTTGAHITKIQTGTGFNRSDGSVIGETDTFHIGDTVHVVFTITTSDQNAQLTFKDYVGSTLNNTSNPEGVDTGTNVYDYFGITARNNGEHKVEIDYNGVEDASITFNGT